MKTPVVKDGNPLFPCTSFVDLRAKKLECYKISLKLSLFRPLVSKTHSFPPFINCIPYTARSFSYYMYTAPIKRLTLLRAISNCICAISHTFFIIRPWVILCPFCTRIRQRRIRFDQIFCPFCCPSTISGSVRCYFVRSVRTLIISIPCYHRSFLLFGQTLAKKTSKGF